jgi:type IV pilus assembly protein PilY1
MAAHAPADWKGTRIFNANPGIGGAGDTGRKSFFKGNATMEGDTVYFFFATGDREHPLNRAVIDRVYAFFDKKDADYSAGPRTESHLVDVTEDRLQEAGTQTQVDATLAALQTKDGWFVRLDGQDLTPPTSNPGEKALASLTLTSMMMGNSIKGILWVTTFRPSTAVNTDICIPGNLGSADALHFDYKTECVINFDITNVQYGSLSGMPGQRFGRAWPCSGATGGCIGRAYLGVVMRITPSGKIGRVSGGRLLRDQRRGWQRCLSPLLAAAVKTDR